MEEWAHAMTRRWMKGRVLGREERGRIPSLRGRLWRYMTRRWGRFVSTRACLADGEVKITDGRIA